MGWSGLTQALLGELEIGAPKGQVSWRQTAPLGGIELPISQENQGGSVEMGTKVRTREGTGKEEGSGRRWGEVSW